MPDLVGHTLNQFRIVEQIGLGGMATVYKAYQPALDRYVAIKILPAYYAHEPGFAERFTREAKAVAKLTHPHVLPIYDFGQENGLNYIVMQYVGAGTLKDMLGQPISLMTVADVIEQIADALDYAHDQGIIHRDVKPSNVLMDRGRWVLLSDFGLAKIVEGSVQLTGSGVGVGTPAYMAPEQGKGLQVDRRADIYSLGILLYEMVTGRVPFEAETPMAVVVKHITEPLPLPSELNPDLPESVERIIMKALAKNPDDRYGTAGKMSAALRKTVAGLDTGVAEAVPSPVGVDAKADEARTVLEEGGATQVVPPPAAPPMPERMGFPIWIAAVVGVLLLVLLMGLSGLARRIRTERTQQAGHATATAAAQALATEMQLDTGERAITPSRPAPQSSPPPERPRSDLSDISLEKALKFMERNPPIFEDDFDEPDPGWQLSSDFDEVEVSRLDGGYVVGVPGIAGQEAVASAALPLEKPLSNFILQLDLETIEGGPGASLAVGFRTQPHSGLYAGLGVEPAAFGIGHYEPDAEVALSGGEAPGYRPEKMSQVILIAMGPNIALYLDGQLVGVARTDMVRPGGLGLNIVSNGDSRVVYLFDNMRVWDLNSLVTPLEPNQGMLIVEDFEDGQANGWDLETGWKIVQEEGDDNHVLLGERHTWAVVGGGEWGDFQLRFRVKPLDRSSILNFRVDPEEPGRARYLVNFVPDEILLHRVFENRDPSVAYREVVLAPDQWHQVELVVQGGFIEIMLDSEVVITYDDPDPLPPGIVSFENGDPPARHLIDDVVIEAIGP